MTGLPTEFNEYREDLAQAKRQLAECLIDHEVKLEKLRETLSDMIQKNQWAPLVLLCAYFPENWGKLIKCEALAGFWAAELKKLLPELNDTRHPFEVIAGRFCSCAGLLFASDKDRDSLAPASQRWLKLGALHFHDYLCCDWLVYKHFKSWNQQGALTDDSRLECEQLACIAAASDHALGHALLAMHYYRVGVFCGKSSPSFSADILRLAVAEAQIGIQRLHENPALPQQDLTTLNFADHRPVIFKAVTCTLKKAGTDDVTSPEESLAAIKAALLDQERRCAKMSGARCR